MADASEADEAEKRLWQGLKVFLLFTFLGPPIGGIVLMSGMIGKVALDEFTSAMAQHAAEVGDGWQVARHVLHELGTVWHAFFLKGIPMALLAAGVSFVPGGIPAMVVGVFAGVQVSRHGCVSRGALCLVSFASGAVFVVLPGSLRFGDRLLMGVVGVVACFVLSLWLRRMGMLSKRAVAG